MVAAHSFAGALVVVRVVAKGPVPAGWCSTGSERAVLVVWGTNKGWLVVLVAHVMLHEHGVVGEVRL